MKYFLALLFIGCLSKADKSYQIKNQNEQHINLLVSHLWYFKDYKHNTCYSVHVTVNNDGSIGYFDSRSLTSVEYKEKVLKDLINKPPVGDGE